MSKTNIRKETLDSYLRERNSNVSNKIPKYFLEICEYEGVNAEYAFAISCFLTNFFKFKSKNINKNNFLQLRNPDGSLHTFKSVEVGVLAVAQYIKYIASTDEIQQEYAYPKMKDMPIDLRGKTPTLDLIDKSIMAPGYDESKYNSYDDAIKNNASYSQSVIKIVNELEILNDIMENEKEMDSIIDTTAMIHEKNEKIIISEKNIPYTVEVKSTNVSIENVPEFNQIVTVTDDSINECKSIEELPYKVCYIYDLFKGEAEKISYKFKGIPYIEEAYQYQKDCECVYIAVFGSYKTEKEAIKHKKILLGKGIRVKVVH